MHATSSLPTITLPTWMRRALRPVDWGALLAFAFGMLFAAPILWQPGLPRANDNEHWVYQTANYARAFGEGRLYPRWSPHALGGYGAPIPHYYPPASAYSAALIQTVFVGQPLEAVRLTYVFVLALAVLPIYAFVARHSGARAGLIACLVYSSCPLISFTTPILLGDLPAALSHLLMPFLLWAVDRLLSADQAIDVALVAFGTAGSLLTDIRYTLLCIPFVLIIVGWHLGRNEQAPVLRTFISIALGVAGAAFFWLPALLEQSAVRWQAVTASPPVQIEIAHLFRGLTQLDPAESTPAPQFTLGAPIGIFSLTSLIPIIRHKRSLDALLLASGVICFSLAVIFEQRWLLSGAALGLSLAASTVSEIARSAGTRLQTILFSLMIALIMLTALPSWLTARPLERVIDTTAIAQLQYELQGFGVAGLPTGWFLPSQLPQELPFNSALIASYGAGDIEKIDPESIPSGVQLGFLDHDTHSDRIQIQSDFGSTISVLTAAFPGWAATATSADVRLENNPNTGLLDLIVPNGINSDITIFLGSTPPRTVGWGISIAAILLLILPMRRRQRVAQSYLADYPLLTQRELVSSAGLWVVSAAIVGIALVGGFAGLRAEPGSGLGGSTPLRIGTDAGIEAIAYRAERTDQNVYLTVYWRALRTLDQNLRLQVSIIDPTSGAVLAQSPIRHPGMYPTRRWLPNRYVSDRQWLQLPPAAGSLPVAARVEVYDCVTICTSSDRVTFFDAQGAPIGQLLPLPIG